MISNAIFLTMLLALPAACMACFLAGAWVHHCAGKGISPLPPLPIGKIKVNGRSTPPAENKSPEVKRAVL